MTQPLSHDGDNNKLSVNTQAAVDEFAEQHGTWLMDPTLHDHCVLVSEEFKAVCVRHNVAAQVIDGLQVGEHPAFPGKRLVLAGHFAVLLPNEAAGIVVDWTARQFDPDAPVPMIMSLHEWRATWPDTDSALGLWIRC
jgi:hypothetical protein